MSYKRIMVAVGSSEVSLLALKEATQLTNALHAQLCIIHVLKEAPVFGVGFGANLEKPQEIVKHDNEVILEKVKKITQDAGITAEFQTIEALGSLESITEKITEAVHSWQADLLVIGTHARSGINRFIFGSTADDTIHMTQVPILLIRAKDPA